MGRARRRKKLVGSWEASRSRASSVDQRLETMVATGDEVVVIESVKAASDVYCPLDGEVVEINQAIVDDPSLVNSDPEGAAWFFKLKLANPSDADALLDEAAYKELIA